MMEPTRSPSVSPRVSSRPLIRMMMMSPSFSSTSSISSLPRLNNRSRAPSYDVQLQQEPRTGGGAAAAASADRDYRMLSDLSAMMLSKVQSNPTMAQVAGEHLPPQSITAPSSGMGPDAAGRSPPPSPSLAGRRAVVGDGRTTAANIKHTTISTEDMGDIVSPALQLRRLKRRLLLETVGTSNDHILMRTARHNRIPSSIERTYSDLSSSSSLSDEENDDDDS